MSSNSPPLSARSYLELRSQFAPPIWVEWAFYLQMFYSIMGGVLGVSLGMVGSAWLGGLAFLCLLRGGAKTIAIAQPMFLLLACGVSFVAVQMLVHGESLMDDYIRDFIPWIVGLVLMQCLALRPGFLDRFALAACLLGFATLPYLTRFVPDPTRAALDRRITINNPNDLGAWFGFCCVYLTILGLETRRNWVRMAAWGAAAVCLGVVGLTVSRGPLFAAAIGIGIAFRRVMKRGIYPFLAILMFGWIAYGLGWFQGAAEMYARRGLEESGRFDVWPMVIQRFIDSPLGGVGVKHLETWVSSEGRGVTPHNGFLFIGLASGVFPLVFFVLFWLRLLFDTLRMKSAEHPAISLLQPLLAYAFLISLQLNEAFMVPWVMAIVVSVANTSVAVAAMQLGQRRISVSAHQRPPLAPAASRRSA